MQWSGTAWFAVALASISGIAIAPTGMKWRNWASSCTRIRGAWWFVCVFEFDELFY
jgi:hypothetical protein